MHTIANLDLANCSADSEYLYNRVLYNWSPLYIVKHHVLCKNNMHTSIPLFMDTIMTYYLL